VTARMGRDELQNLGSLRILNRHKLGAGSLQVLSDLTVACGKGFFLETQRGQILQDEGRLNYYRRVEPRSRLEA
jgi:hypothetical protein